MLLVGLTGGIGAGKSTVARMMHRRGALVFDADELAHKAIEPGTKAYDGIVELFGDSVLTAQKTVDRVALARRVFMDPLAREELESMVHPEVFRTFNEAIEPLQKTDRVVVFDAPLIVETGFDRECDVLLVVTAPEEDRVDRYSKDRHVSEDEVRARMRAQASEEEREDRADAVIHNEGTLPDLERQVDRVWEDIKARAMGAGAST